MVVVHLLTNATCRHATALYVMNTAFCVKRYYNQSGIEGKTLLGFTECAVAAYAQVCCTCTQRLATATRQPQF